MMALLYALSLILVGIARQSCYAEEIPLVAPMGDFLIYEPEDPPGPDGVKTYAATGAAATWGVAQWNMPGGKLSPFQVSGSGAKRILVSHSAEATVRIFGNSSNETAHLSQDGGVLPCLINGQPRESDLLISPNGESIRGGEQGMLRINSSNPKLSEMSHLTLTVTASADFGLLERGKGCEVNQAAVTVGVVMIDTSVHPPQTMFYQLALARFCGPWPAARARICSVLAPQPLIFFNQNPFGTDDALPLLRQPYLRAGETRSFQLDLLPRAKLVIETGPSSIDHDISHWCVNSVYLGQGIWGDVKARTSWSQFQLIATIK